MTAPMVKCIIKQSTWLMIALFIIALIVVFILDYQKLQTEAEQRIRELEDKLNQSIQDGEEHEKALRLEIEQLEQLLQGMEELNKPFDQLQYFLLMELEMKGFKGTPDEIAEDLLTRTDLIPYEGILGGTMGFNEDYIYVLTHNWVIASFDDGHTGGYLLLRYTINDGSISSWEVLDSYLYGD